MNNIKLNNDSQKNLTVLTLISVLTLLLWLFVPFGRFVLYPFIILGTWFHEMGHGLTALLFGANFSHLEIFSNGSGVAYYYGNVFLGRIGNAVIAAAGPIAPTLTGYIFIAASRDIKKSRRLTFIFSILLAVSVIIWVRSIFGILVISLFAAIFFIVSVYGSPKLNKFVCQFIGIQAFLSMYLSINYLFSSKGTTDMGTYYSDTYVMQQMLFLPYWLWALAIIALSLFLIFLSFKKAVSE